MREATNDIASDAAHAGQLDKYMEHLRTSEYESKSASALCAHYRDITARIALEMLKLFHLKTLPRSPFQIVETPAAHAPMAPAHTIWQGRPMLGPHVQEPFTSIHPNCQHGEPMNVKRSLYTKPFRDIIRKVQYRERANLYLTFVALQKIGDTSRLRAGFPFTRAT
jgi:hypothetical protein